MLGKAQFFLRYQRLSLLDSCTSWTNIVTQRSSLLRSIRKSSLLMFREKARQKWRQILRWNMAFTPLLRETLYVLRRWYLSSELWNCFFAPPTYQLDRWTDPEEQSIFIESCTLLISFIIYQSKLAHRWAKLKQHVSDEWAKGQKLHSM